MAWDVLIADILSRSTGACTPAVLSGYIAIEKEKSHDVYQLVRGHDVAAALGIALRKVLGDRRDVHTWASEIEAGLRLAFDWSAMASTGLYQCLHAWEVANEPYRIFQR